MIRSELRARRGRRQRSPLLLVPIAVGLVACATAAPVAPPPVARGSPAQAAPPPAPPALAESALEPEPLISSAYRPFRLNEAADFGLRCFAEDGGFWVELQIALHGSAEDLVSPERLLVTVVTRTGAVHLPEKLSAGLWHTRHRASSGSLYFVFTHAGAPEDLAAVGIALDGAVTWFPAPPRDADSVHGTHDHGSRGDILVHGGVADVTSRP